MLRNSRAQGFHKINSGAVLNHIQRKTIQHIHTSDLRFSPRVARSSQNHFQSSFLRARKPVQSKTNSSERNFAFGQHPRFLITQGKIPYRKKSHILLFLFFEETLFAKSSFSYLFCWTSCNQTDQSFRRKNLHRYVDIT